MAEFHANSEVAVRAKWMWPRSLRLAAAIVLAAAAILPSAPAAAQQNGPPTSGPNASILFVPATLSPVSGFNPANGHLNGAGYGGDGILANSSSSQFSYPVGMAYDTNGNLFIADSSNHVVRRIDAVTGDLSTFAGQQNNPGFYPISGSAPALSAQFYSPSGLVIDSNNNIYVSDRSNEVVWKITSGGSVSIFAGAGTGTCGGSQSDTLGDNCPAVDATLDNPWALGIDANNIYIADSYNDLVRKISSSTGIITVFAGDVADAGTFGACNASAYSVPRPGPYLATQAHLGFPEGVAFDSNGNAYISSATCDIVQEVDSNGFITTFAGARAVRSTTGDGGLATAATLNEPAGIYVDPANRVYISDFFGAEIRMVDSTGNINDVMGNTHGGLNNYSIGEPDTEALSTPSSAFTGAANGIYSVLMDPYGNLLASDSSGDAITYTGTTGQYYFGNQLIYQTVSTTSLNAQSPLYPPNITISNPSNVTLNFAGTPTVTTLTPSATPAAFAITGGTCDFSGSLAPGQSCTVVVSFTPTTAAPYTGTIVFNSNSNSSPNTILLSGSGYGYCSLSASLSSPSTFSSPPNVQSATQAATLTNTGLCPISPNSSSAVITNNLPANSNAFSVVSNNCPATLNGGASCTFNIAFTPAAVTSYSARMQLSIPGYGNLYSYFNGNGVVAPAAQFNPTSLVFPTTSDGATSSAMSTLLTNIGNATMTGISVNIAGSNPGYFAFSGTNNCGSSLAAGASCTISVDFAPQAALTNYAATISVTDNAAGSPQTVALTGTGSAALPPIVINDSEIIHTIDAPAFTPSTLILDTEIIHTTDAPSLTPSTLILDTEIIHTADSPVLTPSTLILDTENIHTSDAPSLTPSRLILDTEIIHTTDVPVVTPQSPSQSGPGSSAAPTMTLLTSSTPTSAAGFPVTFTATVASAAATPSGSVTFYDGTTPLTTVSLTSGTATFATSSLSAGTHSISAVYSGAALFLASTSNTFSESVIDFTLSLTGGSTGILTILPGSSGTYTLTITPATPPPSGYTATINWGTTGVPAGGTATFNPNPVMWGTAPVTTTLTITIPAAIGLLQPQRPEPQGPSPTRNRAPLLLGALLPLLGLRRAIKRSLPRLIVMALVSICVAMGISSCAGNYFNQSPQSYIVTITATSGTIQHSTTITLNIP